jgi:hypothetical protein
LKEKEKDTIKVESSLKNVKDSKKQEEKKKQQIIKVHIYFEKFRMIFMLLLAHKV